VSALLRTHGLPKKRTVQGDTTYPSRIRSPTRQSTLHATDLVAEFRVWRFAGAAAGVAARPHVEVVQHRPGERLPLFGRVRSEFRLPGCRMNWLPPSGTGRASRRCSPPWIW